MSLEIIIVLFLIVLNGCLALAEIAIVSSRRSRLRQLASGGNQRAAAALALAETPTRFLSTIQVGITLLTVVSGAFAGRTVAEALALRLAPLAWIGPYADRIALALVVVLITFLAVIFGELVPKRVALNRPERLAMFVAPTMQRLARIGGPLVWLLTTITDGITKLFGMGRSKETSVSDEEVSLLIEQGLSEGVFHEAEKQMVEAVLDLDHLAVTAIMTPKPKMVWLDIADPEEVSWRKIVASGHSHFPVYEHSQDNVVGMLSVKALWANSAAGFETPMRDLLTRPLYVPETISSIQLLETFKRSGRHIGLVTDEFGTVSGIVTLIDVLEAIVGDLPVRGQQAGPQSRVREDGSWLVDATMPLVDLKELLGLDELPGEDRADFQTLGGLVMTHFGRIPKAGDVCEAGGFRWEVLAMDRFRVDKVAIKRLPPPVEATPVDE